MLNDSWTVNLSGFALGLLSALFLAVLVNPWVARRVERRSRWLDRAQIALEQLTWEVEPALRASRQEALTTIPLRNEYGRTDITEILELLEKWSESEHERFAALSTSVKRTATLMRYVCYAQPHSDALAALDLQWKRVELYLRGIEHVRMDIATTQASVLAAYDDAQGGLIESIGMLEKMVFAGGPPRRTLREWVRRTWRRFTRQRP